MSTPCHESTLPAVLTVRDLGALLGIATRTVYDHMAMASWPFTPIPGFTNRWSRDHVLAVLAGQSTRRYPKSA
jgi:hypothetical protein